MAPSHHRPRLYCGLGMRAILENERVVDFSADEAAPPREGRHAGTALQIHERLFHHQIVTAWVSYHEVGVCRAPTHAASSEATARSLPPAIDAVRGSGEAVLPHLRCGQVTVAPVHISSGAEQGLLDRLPKRCVKVNLRFPTVFFGSEF